MIGTREELWVGAFLTQVEPFQETILALEEQPLAVLGMLMKWGSQTLLSEASV